MAENVDIKKIQESMPDFNAIGALSDFFKIMGDSTRLQIILSLQNGELCVTDIATCLDMSISSVSHQLKSLRLARIIKQRKEGRTVYYSLDDGHVADILATSLEHVSHII
ncbi:MAG: winged helix-turn-helix transcriptional regulator [Oscillospiraceae bacterium]|nr:winged helix-turn-helix transcriptional regulator [Oscillospiraceae bacterium]